MQNLHIQTVVRFHIVSSIHLPTHYILLQSDSLTRQPIPWSDLENEQADPGLRCLNMQEDTFRFDMYHLY